MESWVTAIIIIFVLAIIVVGIIYFFEPFANNDVTTGYYTGTDNNKQVVMKVTLLTDGSYEFIYYRNNGSSVSFKLKKINSSELNTVLGNINKVKRVDESTILFTSTPKTSQKMYEQSLPITFKLVDTTTNPIIINIPTPSPTPTSSPTQASSSSTNTPAPTVSTTTVIKDGYYVSTSSVAGPLVSKVTYINGYYEFIFTPVDQIDIIKFKTNNLKTELIFANVETAITITPVNDNTFSLKLRNSLASPDQSTTLNFVANVDRYPNYFDQFFLPDNINIDFQGTYLYENDDILPIKFFVNSMGVPTVEIKVHNTSGYPVGNNLISDSKTILFKLNNKVPHLVGTLQYTSVMKDNKIYIHVLNYPTIKTYVFTRQ